MINIAENYQDDSVKACLVIYGYEGGLQKLTHELELQPDRSAEKDGKRFPRSMWSYQSKLPTSATIEEHIDWLLDALRPHKDKIKQIGRKYEAKISVGATYYWYNADFEIDPAVLSEIANLGVKLWLDIYCLGREYLMEGFQREQFKRVLQARDAARKLGITGKEEIAAITEVLHLLEEYSSSIPDDFFPDYGDDRDIEDEDLAKALFKLRKNLARLHLTAHESQFLSDNPSRE